MKIAFVHIVKLVMKPSAANDSKETGSYEWNPIGRPVREANELFYIIVGLLTVLKSQSLKTQMMFTTENAVEHLNRLKTDTCVY